LADALATAAQATAQLQASPFDSTDLANTAWAFATLLHRQAPLMEIVAAKCKLKAFEFDTQEVCNTVWALGTCERKGYAALDATSQHRLRLKSEFSPEELTKVT